ncbi:MAG: VanZ family protein [Candidatus Omnitrophota bacterium]
MRKLSKLTVGFGTYIVLSAFFMLQVRTELARVLGDEALFKLLQVFFLALVAFTLYYAYQKNLMHSHILAVIFVYFAAWTLAVNQPFFTEQTHVFTYGFLGYLAVRDLARAKVGALRRVVESLFFVTLVSLADELVQGILPYRFGDIRDVVTNILSGALGVAQGLVIQTGIPAPRAPRADRSSTQSEGSE